MAAGSGELYDTSFISDEMLSLWRRLTAMQRARPGKAHHSVEYFNFSTEFRQLLGLKTWEWGPHEVGHPEDAEDGGRTWRLRQAFQRAARERG